MDEAFHEWLVKIFARFETKVVADYAVVVVVVVAVVVISASVLIDNLCCQKLPKKGIKVLWLLKIIYVFIITYGKVLGALAILAPKAK